MSSSGAEKVGIIIPTLLIRKSRLRGIKKSAKRSQVTDRTTSLPSNLRLLPHLQISDNYSHPYFSLGRPAQPLCCLSTFSAGSSMPSWLAVDKPPGRDWVRMETEQTPHPPGPQGDFKGLRCNPSHLCNSCLPCEHDRLACSPPASISPHTSSPASLISHMGPVTLVIQVRTWRPMEGMGLRTHEQISSRALAPRLWAQWGQEPPHSYSFLVSSIHLQAWPVAIFIPYLCCGEGHWVTHFLYLTQRALYIVGP